MKQKLTLSITSLILVLGIGLSTYAQTPQYEKCCGTASSQFPFKNNGGAKTQLWYDPADFSVTPPSGMITKVYFRCQVAGQSGTYNNFKIFLKQPASGTGFSTSTTFETGLTQVYFNAVENVVGSSVVGGWYSFTLTTPFPYNNTLPLVIETQFDAPFIGVGIDNLASPTTLFRKIYSSNLTATTGTASNSWWQDFGIDLVTICNSPPTGGSVTASSNPACQGSSVTLDLTGHTFGTGQTYQWESAPALAGPWTAVGGSQPNSPISVSPGTATYYRCELTCSSMSSYSTALQVNVNTPVPPSISIVSSHTSSFCKGTNVTFTATPVNGGPTPDYQWSVNSVLTGPNSDIFSTTSLSDKDTIRCELTSSDACITTPTANSNEIIVDVDTLLPTSVTITASPGASVCEGDSIIFKANPVNEGSTPTFQWKKNAVNVGTNSDTFEDKTPTNGNFITCQVTSSEVCVTAAVVNATPLVEMIYPDPDRPTITKAFNDLTSSMASTYQWRLDGTPITGATSQSHTATASGWYSVVISDTNGCFSTSDNVFHELIVGIDELNGKHSISVYPSPFTDKITLYSGKDNTPYFIEIRDLTGQVLYETNMASQTVELDLSTLSSGMYVLSVKSEGTTTAVRIIKK